MGVALYSATEIYRKEKNLDCTAKPYVIQNLETGLDKKKEVDQLISRIIDAIIIIITFWFPYNRNFCF